jgi:toxin FitB
VILVDTNVWSVATKARRETKVLNWIEAHKTELRLSPIVVAEIRFGLELPRAAERKEELQRWLAALEEEYRDQLLPFDGAAGHSLGLLLLAKPQEVKLLDTLLAAQALAHDCPIATRNVKDFEWTGVTVIDPWTA